MTDNIFNFEQTNQALGKLSETIIRLDTALKNRQIATAASDAKQEKLLAKKDQQLDMLRQASVDVLENIDSILNRIDNVLENNGSGNNNN